MPNVSETKLSIDGKLSIEYSDGSSGVVDLTAVADVTNIALAQSLDSIITGTITRDANGAATSAPLAWPDGATGVYTATTVSTAFPGAVDAYTVTHVLGGVTKTYTQPAVTRDGNGAVISKPAMTVV